MIRDPEQLRDERRERGPRVQTSALNRERHTVDRLASPARWVALWRGDGWSLEAIAADVGCSVDQVREGIDAELRAAGTTIAEVEARRAAPGVRLGNGTAREVADA